MQAAEATDIREKPANTDNGRQPDEVSRWEPKWLIEVGHDGRVGLTIDDGCFVVLYPKASGTWHPGTHIPKAVAEQISTLLSDQRLR